MYRWVSLGTLGVFVMMCLFFSVMLVRPANAEIVKIEEILEHLESYKDQVVVVDGVIWEQDDERDNSRTTDFFLIRDEFGGIIRVRTKADRPEFNKRFRIEGIVDVDELSGGKIDAFITEYSRVPVGDTPPPPPPIQQVQCVNCGVLNALGVENCFSCGKDTAVKEGLTLVQMILIGMVVLAIILAIVLMAIHRSTPQVEDVIQPLDGQNPFGGNSSVLPTSSDNEIIIDTGTIKIAAPQPGTVKMFPGFLEVLQGGDTSLKRISFYSKEITFGRDKKPGYGHVEINDGTVSRAQAKLLLSGDKFLILNQSETNHTQVNGNLMDKDGSVELTEGDEIAMGQVVFKFRKV